MVNGTETWVTDGSYNHKVTPLVSGASWILYCLHTKQKMHGLFFKRSPCAGYYCGKLLGLLAIHILAIALEQYYDVVGKTGRICCNNQGALHKSSNYHRYIPVGAHMRILNAPYAMSSRG